MMEPSHDDLIRRLDAHPLAEPPAELHPRIMGAIGQTGRGVRPQSRGASMWTSPSRLRLVTTFGLGLATGVVLLAAIQFGRPDAWNFSRTVDPSQVSGAMLEPEPDRELLGSLPVSVAQAGVTGSADVYRVGAETRFDLSLQSSQGSPEWVLSFDPAAWQVSRVERPAGAGGRFAAGPGEVRGSATGTGPLTVVMTRLAPTEQPVVFQIVESGRVVFERSVPTSTPGGL
jgi:hypothetical protein